MARRNNLFVVEMDGHHILVVTSGGCLTSPRLILVSTLYTPPP